jgi:hypothetical protein
MIQRKIYAACLQTRGKQGASRMTAPRAGTNTTSAGTFVTFDVPGATSTNSNSINNSGTTTGHYTDAAGLTHSFLRTSDGAITPFDPPGATCKTPPAFPGVCSLSYDINPAATIVGVVVTSPDFSTGHGFLRAPNGTFTEFDVPFSVYTQAEVINPDGVVAGNSFATATSFVAHGFIRAPNGTITTFDPLGSTFTQPSGINPAGTVTGNFSDVRGGEHGFLRTSDGTITVLDAPGSLSNFGTEPHGINPAGAIVGTFYSPDGSLAHGFLRAPNGTFTVFDPTDSLFTFPQDINPGGLSSDGFFPPTSQRRTASCARPTAPSPCLIPLVRYLPLFPPSLPGGPSTLRGRLRDGLLPPTSHRSMAS